MAAAARALGSGLSARRPAPEHTPTRSAGREPGHGSTWTPIGDPQPGSIAAAAQATGATIRQLDYWIRRGHLTGDNLKASGSGSARRFTDVDLEVATAIHRLSALGCRSMWLTAGADATRAARVEPGELLVVTLTGCATDRTREAVFPTGPAWIVPLTPYRDGRPR